MRAECLPLASVYDPAVDPPTSVDLMGTTATAEQVFEVLFPGVTNRMWRTRLLTLSALASVIADRGRKKGRGSFSARASDEP